MCIHTIISMWRIANSQIWKLHIKVRRFSVKEHVRNVLRIMFEIHNTHITHNTFSLWDVVRTQNLVFIKFRALEVAWNTQEGTQITFTWLPMKHFSFCLSTLGTEESGNGCHYHLGFPLQLWAELGSLGSCPWALILTQLSLGLFVSVFSIHHYVNIN